MKGAALTADAMKTLDESMDENPEARTLAGIVPRVPAVDALNSFEALSGDPHLFSHTVSKDVSVTSQHSTGRCWIFAALNCVRAAMVHRYGLPSTFELSQAHVFYWDKLERANWFLHSVWDSAGEGADSRVMQHLLSSPSEDGGQWAMLTAIIEKHGLMPKSQFPDLVHGRASATLNGALNAKLREFAGSLVSLKKDGGSDADAQGMIGGMMGVVHRTVTTCLGRPPAVVDFEYRPQGGKGLVCARGMTPLAFYRDIVKPCFDFSAYVSVVHDPRPEHPVGSIMTVAKLGSVVASPFPVRYINATPRTLKELVIGCLTDDIPVWFGCDVGKSLHRARGVLSLANYDFAGVLGVCRCMSKEDRIRYKHSLMTHAMTFSGYHVPSSATSMADFVPASSAKKAPAAASGDAEAGDDAAASEDKASPPAVDDVSRFRVDNSWGNKGDGSGRLSMTSAWFDEYVYQIAVHKDRLPADMRALVEADADVIVLPPWDPLGALAEGTSLC